MWNAIRENVKKSFTNTSDFCSQIMVAECGARVKKDQNITKT